MSRTGKFKQAERGCLRAGGETGLNTSGERLLMGTGFLSVVMKYSTVPCSHDGPLGISTELSTLNVT